MTSTQNLTPATTFVLQDSLTGNFRPERVSYEEAKAIAAADGFLTVRRLDEVLRETGRA
jgi:hypothetical protein